MTKTERSRHWTPSAILCILLPLMVACSTLEVNIEYPSASTGSATATVPTSVPSTTSATPLPMPEASPTPDVSGWGTFTDYAFGVSFRYPAGWQPASATDDAESTGATFTGDDGFFQISAMGGSSLDDVVASEAEHHLRPYGSQPVIESLRVAGQEARLILPAGDQSAGMADQAALIVRYPQPLVLSGQTYEFFVLWADQAHIRAIAQTLQFKAEALSDRTATPAPPITWETLPPGLVFSTSAGLNLIDAEERPVLLHDDPQAALSPEGSRLLTYDATQQDVWMLNRAEGAIWRLTDTPERQECCLRWWPGRPDIVLFQSTPPGAEGPISGAPGYLTAVGVDGQGYHILDPDHAFGLDQFDPSPDGEAIAYSDGETAWLYRWGGAERFDPADYGLVVRGAVQINQPAWSPDGRRLAWIVKAPLAVDGGLRVGVALFELEARTAQVLHSYEPPGEGWPSAPAWSPDGAWLAFGDSSTSERAGLWIARVQGEVVEERHLGLGGNPVWSPDGRWLAFQSVGEEGLPAYVVLDVETWERRTLNLPVDRYGQLVDWIHMLPDAAP